MQISRRALVQGVGLTAGTGIVLAACGGGGDDTGDDGTAAPGSEGELPMVTANGGEPENPLVPTNTNIINGIKLLRTTFSGLTYFDAEGALQMEMAEAIDTEDNQNFTITIADGWTFTDGSAVTAQSFVDAWNYGANINNAQANSYFFEPIAGYAEIQAEGTPPDATMSGLAVVDDQTFTVALTSPQADFQMRLGYIAFVPLPAVAFEDMDAFGQKPVGNGPYMVEDWENNVSATIVRNPDYAGPREAQNGGYLFTFYQDAGTGYNDLLSGNLDIFDLIPDEAVTVFKDDLGERAVDQPGAAITNLVFASWDPRFQGEAGALRRAAISRSINRQEICDAILAGTATPALDFTTPILDGHNDAIPGAEVIQFDAAAATDLWAQAEALEPWDGSQLTFTYNADGDHQTWIEAVANQVKNTLGIDAVGNAVPDSKTMYDMQTSQSNPGVFRQSWVADYPSMLNFLGPLFHSTGGSNRTSYSSPDFDATISEAQAQTEEQAQYDKVYEAQQILFQDLPSIPLWNASTTGGFSEHVEDVTFGWDGIPLYEQVTKQ